MYVCIAPTTYTTKQLTLSHKNLIDVKKNITALHDHPFNAQIFANIFRLAHFIMHNLPQKEVKQNISKRWNPRHCTENTNFSYSLGEDTKNLIPMKTNVFFSTKKSDGKTEHCRREKSTLRYPRIWEVKSTLRYSKIWEGRKRWNDPCIFFKDSQWKTCILMNNQKRSFSRRIGGGGALKEK